MADLGWQADGLLSVDPEPITDIMASGPLESQTGAQRNHDIQETPTVLIFHPPATGCRV